MKLKPHRYSEKEKLSEFDMWITPSLGDIKDTMEFRNVLDALECGFRSLVAYTDHFKDANSCSAYHIAEGITREISKMDDPEVHFSNVFQALLLATGKTDNNLKCQFPIVLCRLFEDKRIAAVKSGRLCRMQIPRDFNIEKVIKHLASLASHPDFLAPLLKSYLDLLLSDNDYVLQLFSLGKSYLALAEEGQARNLLASMAIFQSRGSVTAKTGHLPEKILRRYMSDWGMEADADFNSDDIDVCDLLGMEKGKNEKSRKYDFVVPYRSRQTGKKLFVQSQFYAGDSGSVSHKAVDQTDAARRQTLKKYPQAVFIEYLDGAGYFSSLNGDLKKMLGKKTTKDFIQIRTAPIKFRRDLQAIDFITPLEIEHLVLKGHKTRTALAAQLRAQGYERSEIKRSLDVCQNGGILEFKGGKFAVKKERVDISLKYSLLDCIANFGHAIRRDKEKGVICVPGYVGEWGLNQSELLDAFSREFPLVGMTAKELVSRIQWLLDNEFAILK